MANFPGTFEVRINYTTDEPVSINNHELRLSCEMSIEADPGDPFDEWTPVQKNGSAVTTLDTHVDNLVADLRPLFFTAVDFTDAELWEYAPGTFDAIFRSSYTLGLAGTGATATIPLSQTIITFRSTLGGIAKVDLRGTITAAGVKIAFPIGAGGYTDLATGLTDGTSIFHARDGGYFVSPLTFLPGSNERAFKKVNR